MKLQTAIDFLSTYSFAFLIFGVLLVAILFLASATRSAAPSQCSAVSVLTCNYAGIYTSIANSYSIITFSIINSQAAPINITNLTVLINSVSSIGICTPQFVNPSQYTICVANISWNPSIGNLVQGSFVLNTKYCNSGINSLTNKSCSYQNASYNGQFSAAVNRNRTIIYGAVAAIGNSSIQDPIFFKAPQISPGFSISQNGDWVAQRNSTGSYIYALGETPYNGITSFLGINSQRYPGSVSSLNNNAVQCYATVSCSGGSICSNTLFNTTASVAYTTLYLASNSNIYFTANSADGITAYYKAYSSNSWTNLFGNTLWKGHAPSSITANAVLTKGLNSIAVSWFNDCGKGIQAFGFNGLPT